MFKVRVRLGETRPWLRPGMAGTAKIDIDRRSYLIFSLYATVAVYGAFAYGVYNAYFAFEEGAMESVYALFGKRPEK